MTDHEGTTWNSDDSSDTDGASEIDEDEIISDEWLEFRLKMRDLFPHKHPPSPYALLHSPTETQTIPTSFWFSIAEEFINHHYDEVDGNTDDVALQLQYYYDLY